MPQPNSSLINRSSFGNTTYGDSYEHPLFRYLTHLIPRRLRPLFRLCEQVFMGPQASAGIRKIAEYPVTDPEIFSNNEKDKEKIIDLFANTFQVRREITKSMYNMFVYGNDFTSFHRPFTRFVRCESCGAETNIRKLPEFKYSYKNVSIQYKCPACNKHATGQFHDRAVTDINRCTIIHWDPKRIDIDHCSVTKESEYYYTPAPMTKAKVREGNEHLVTCLPKGMLEAISKDIRFKFNAGEIFHMKVDGPAGMENESGWGIPLLISAIETYLYISVMRKGNESAAMERIESFRMVYPAATTANGDPSFALSVSRHMMLLEENYEFWRRSDRNALMFSPVPVGVAQIGGDARPMLTNAEIQAAEDNILALLGIPREFVYGGMSYGPGSGAVLRQIENQLVAHISQTSGLLQWLTDKICSYLGMSGVIARLGKFTVQDDAMNKQAAMQLFQQNELSAESFTKLFGYNRREEQDRIMEETLDKVRRDQELQKKMQDLQNDIATQAQMQAQNHSGATYNVQAVMASGQQVVDGMLQDPTMAQSTLAQLQNQDPVMYSVVRMLWDQAQYQTRQGGGAPA